MKITEKIFGAILLISIIMKLFNIPGNGVLFTSTALSLIILYFYLGFVIFNDIGLKGIFKKDSYKYLSVLRIIGSIGAGMGLSTILMGVLFRLQHWAGANLNLAIGLMFSLIVVVIGLIRYLKNKDKFYLNLLLRFVVIGGFGLTLFFTTDYTIHKILYRNYPDYIKVLDDLHKNPDNEKLRERAEYEYNKMFLTKKEIEYLNMSKDNK